MSWKDAYSYLRGVATRHGAGPTDTRQDSGLPMGARIGSLITLQQSPLIRANASGSLIRLPSSADTRILALSQLRLSMAGMLYRYYLAKGDLDAQEIFVQLYKNQQGEIAELMYCTQLARVIPETADDQDAYTGVAGYGLGDAKYTLWREQLGDIGLGAAELDRIFGDAEQLVYQRDAGDPELEFMPPFAGSETRIDDAGGIAGLKQELFFMPYVRELDGGGREYLLITTEIIASVNGDTSQRGIHVDFVIGIPVEQERVFIQ
jgi:hypothetical protein